ncbi:MAG: Rid family detoxifying hydrolase [Armatimonadota bacterium]|jgi:2-iminobutanoate/2-iminopropanoate deaminase
MAKKEIVISDRLPAPKGPYSPAVKANGLVFVSGQGPIDPETGEVLRGSIEQQMELVLHNIATILTEAGSSLDLVVKTNVYLDTIEDFATMNAVYATFFTKEPPARTTIEAANLPLGIGVEIDVIALQKV